MAETVTKVTGTKVTKKDLEEEILALEDDINSLRGAQRALIQQNDEYAYLTMTQNQSLRNMTAQIEAKDRELQEYRSACALNEEVLRRLIDASDTLQRHLNMREAQLQFNLRVMQSILAYKGDNLSVVHGLVESVLSECEERS